MLEGQDVELVDVGQALVLLGLVADHDDDAAVAAAQFWKRPKIQNFIFVRQEKLI